MTPTSPRTSPSGFGRPDAASARRSTRCSPRPRDTRSGRCCSPTASGSRSRPTARRRSPTGSSAHGAALEELRPEFDANWRRLSTNEAEGTPLGRRRGGFAVPSAGDRAARRRRRAVSGRRSPSCSRARSWSSATRSTRSSTHSSRSGWAVCARPVRRQRPDERLVVVRRCGSWLLPPRPPWPGPRSS